MLKRDGEEAYALEPLANMAPTHHLEDPAEKKIEYVIFDMDGLIMYRTSHKAIADD